MLVRIFSTPADQILAHVAREHPREACGLLLGRGDSIEAIVEATNVAENPEATFEIDPAVLLSTYREAREGGRAVLGWYHSHPNGRGEPSATDAARAEKDGRLWLIVAGGAFRIFISGDGPVQRRFTELPHAIIAETP